MRKGQISAEYILIAIMILGSSFIAFKYFQAEGFNLVTDSLLKTSVDWELASSALEHPKCDIFLGGIYANRTKYTSTFQVQASNSTGADPYCTSVVLSRSVRNRIQGLISSALGCDPSTNGSCKGHIYTIGTR
ncbi:MAG: hypothetical protein J7L23_00445 [Candidatus Diapherotrites archaeon]|nr:hypothetical protein [Candidatus Diapherotrites archaeon]